MDNIVGLRPVGPNPTYEADGAFMEAGPWNWLEVAKLAAVLLMPVALAVFGVYIHRVTKRFEHLQWRSQKLIEKRLAIYDDLAPHFNDLLC